jgi:hypothetical protein
MAHPSAPSSKPLQWRSCSVVLTIERATVLSCSAGGFLQASGDGSPRSTFYPCRPLSASHPMLCSPKAIWEALV